MPTTDDGVVSTGDEATTGAEGCGAGWSEDLALGPGAVMLAEGLAVPIDVVELRAELLLDVAAETTRVAAELTFRVGETEGRPIFDLRQEPDAGLLDGAAIGALWTREFGDGPGTEVRVLDQVVEACSEHTLRLEYTLVRPPGFAADPPEFEEDGVSWGFALNDVAPRMFLEQWLPANLIHDRHPIALTLMIAGGAADQRVITNGETTERGAGVWDIEFAAGSTALSPMLVLAPASEVVSSSAMVGAVQLDVHRHQGVSESPEALLQALGEAFAEFEGSTGAYLYPRFTAFVTKNAGMEYDGGATTDAGSLTHEVFHSWWGRGVRPRRASDGWIDEAWNEWNTGSPTFTAAPMDLDGPPVVLCKDSAWHRATPIAAYSVGKAVFAAIAAESGVAELRAAMRGFYAAHTSVPVTTEMLELYLHCELAAPSLRALFHRFVYGRKGAPGPAPTCEG